MNVEATLPSRRYIPLCVLLGALAFSELGCQNVPSLRQPAETPAPTILKQPVHFASRTFDPANPPAEMPPLYPGENAECESNFKADADIGGPTRRTDATHAILTIRKIKITLELDVTIWVPLDVTQHVSEHEQGHRQISENYYQTADSIAQRIAATYMDRQVSISGADLAAEANKALQQIGAEITGEYSKELDPNPAQLLYDSITDHSRNEVVATDAVAHAIKNVSIESPDSASERKASDP